MVVMYRVRFLNEYQKMNKSLESNNHPGFFTYSTDIQKLFSTLQGDYALYAALIVVLRIKL